MWSFADHKPELRATLMLGLPLALSHVAQVAIGAVDTLMVGWYGVIELAALSVAGSLWFTVYIAISGFAWAVTPMIAAASERGDDLRIRRVARMAFWWVTLCWVVALVPMWQSETVLLWLGQEPEVARAAQAYLQITGFAMLPALWVTVLKSYLSALEHTAIALWVAAAAIVPNAALNYMLIFGHFGMPEMGVQGAALASLVVQIGSMAALIWYAVRVFPQHTLFARLWRSDWEVFGQVYRLGWPISVTSVSESGLFTGAALLMGMIGTIELAAHGVAIQITSLTFVMHLGLAQAATVRAGRAVGRGSLIDLHRAGRVAVVLSVLMALLTMALFLSVPEPLIALFLSPDEPQREAILSIGVVLLAMAAVFQLVDGGQVMALGLLRGLEDTQRPMIIAALSYWGLGMPVSYVLGIQMGLGAVGVWLGLVIGLSAAAIALMYRFWWRVSVSIPQGAE